MIKSNILIWPLGVDYETPVLRAVPLLIIIPCILIDLGSRKIRLLKQGTSQMGICLKECLTSR